MNCTRVFHILTPPLPTGCIMPIDIAMRICLARSPPLRNFLGPYDPCRGRSFANRLKPLRPCISSKNEAGPCHEEWADSKDKRKKSVVFADDKGLSLTQVNIFSEFEDPLADLQFDLTDLEYMTCGLKINEIRNLILDFTLPSADYLTFRNHLKKNFVSLENCALREKSIEGTVKVKNISYHKLVQIRITFDSWKTFKDVECSYLNDVYGSVDNDTFSFVVDLPSSSLSLQERIEFCVSFKSGHQTYWDNNNGENYRIVHAEWKPDGIQAPITFKSEVSKNGGKVEAVECDQYGSPRASSFLFPDWQTWSRIEKSLPYW
eukprot:gi/632936434/ref/XP_007894919.1/ PREDICTED: LOW QUALITY PROTEIN: protein phosphatase 1 regulatory subunit 3C [Callorhinchus milii]